MDKRKNNGNRGHSTKSKGIDKRKNEYKDALSEALTQDDLISVIKMLYSKSINDEDTPAAKLILEYYLGRPHQSLDVTSAGDKMNIPVASFFDTKQ